MGISLNGLTPANTYPGLIKTGDNTAISGTPKVLSDGNGNNLPMEVSTTGVNFTNNLTQGGTALQPVLVSGTNIKTINSTSILGSGNINVATLPSGVAGAIQFSNGSAFASDASNLFWDDTNNRLGLGTATPTTLLNLSGSSEATPSGTTGGILNIIGSATNALVMGSLSTSPFGLYIQGGGSGVYPLLLNPNGSNVGIATTDPTAKLHIKGSGTTSGTTSLLVQNSAGAQTMKLDDSGRLFMDANNYIGQSGEWVCSLNFVINGNIGNSNSGYVQLIKAYASNGLVAGTTTLNASAILEANSTTQGFLPPRMTTTQKNNIASPAAGLVVYDSTLGKLCVRTASAWETITSV
jgi:hypothetical protein